MAKNRIAPGVRDGLTQQQMLFVLYYVGEENGNASASAKRAGYAPSTAGRLIKDERILKKIEEYKEFRVNRLGITADWVINELKDLYKRAKSSESYGPATKMLEMLGKEAGVFSDKAKVVEHKHSFEALLDEADIKDITPSINPLGITEGNA